MGVDTLKLLFREPAEILKSLLPGFKEGIFSAPPVEIVSLDDATDAYRAIIGEGSGKKYVIRFE